MGVLDRDGDLEGVTPADTLGEYAGLVAWLRNEADHKKLVDLYARLDESADAIESLAKRLARAEACIEKVRTLAHNMRFDDHARLWQARLDGITVKYDAGKES